MHALAERGGTALLSALYRTLAARGVRMQPGARVTDLYVDGEQRVRGVRYIRGERDAVDIGCSALVLATNGFAGNDELGARCTFPMCVRCHSRDTMVARVMHWPGARNSAPRSMTSMAFSRTARS